MRRRTSNVLPGRGTSAASVLVGLGALFLGVAPVATAAPTDTVLPVPVIGITNLPTGFLSPVYSQVMVRTDPEAPGMTEFVEYCVCTVHWRNLTTGAAGAVVPSRSTGPVLTGSGTVVAVLTVNGWSDRPGVLTALPGAGTWNVP
ncbi:hypothetical protein COO55_32355 [Rhodococcus opacus]|uniref:Uncharacterized protein n=2 Tax=Rhodococcus opacus TaxID=37919 RepID=K8XKN4_RHOOP|nr:hypothetical protein [Rhodococcus opacus]EKT82183.1 hypothetical protein WSS_A13162 [Rhodococcus opacus M213]QZS57102.1 hypothetical protein FXW36_08805 [Rhodococcus opacus]RKM76268.1 hypothetical protein COO55_32355 [Rhodococcus opacus]